MLNNVHKLPIFTIGHSTRPAKEFLDLLELNQIETVIDVRSLPGSNRYPHFNKERLKKFLKKHQISYFHVPELGGRRRPKPDSKNTTWRNPSFQGYADYMNTDEFQLGLARVMRKAEKKRVALMCAEAVPWRCHRGLIADSLNAHEFDVIDIISKTNKPHHHLPLWAKVKRNSKFGKTLEYSGPEGE